MAANDATEYRSEKIGVQILYVWGEPWATKAFRSYSLEGDVIEDLTRAEVREWVAEEPSFEEVD